MEALVAYHKYYGGKDWTTNTSYIINFRNYGKVNQKNSFHR